MTRYLLKLTRRWRTEDDEVLDERQQEKLRPNPPAAAQEGEGAQREGYPGGRPTSVAAAKSNVAAVASSSRTAVAGSSRTAAMSSQLDRSEDDDEDVQEDSPELDELERKSDPLSTSSLLC